MKKQVKEKLGILKPQSKLHRKAFVPSSSTGQLVERPHYERSPPEIYILSQDTDGHKRTQPALLPAALWRWAGCSQDSTWSPPRAEGQRQPTDKRPHTDPGRHPPSSPALPPSHAAHPFPGLTWPPPPQRPLYTPGLSSCRPSSRSQAYCGWPTSSEDMAAADRRHPARFSSGSSETAARRQPSIAGSRARVGGGDAAMAAGPALTQPAPIGGAAAAPPDRRRPLSAAPSVGRRCASRAAPAAPGRPQKRRPPPLLMLISCIPTSAITALGTHSSCKTASDF